MYTYIAMRENESEATKSTAYACGNSNLNCTSIYYEVAEHPWYNEDDDNNDKNNKCSCIDERNAILFHRNVANLPMLCQFDLWRMDILIRTPSEIREFY